MVCCDAQRRSTLQIAERRPASPTFGLRHPPERGGIPWRTAYRTRSLARPQTHAPVVGLQVVPEAQHDELPPTSQHVSDAPAQQTVPPPQSLPLSQQSSNSTLQTACALTQQLPSGQLTPLAQQLPSLVQEVPGAQQVEEWTVSQHVSDAPAQQTVPPPQSLPVSQQSPNSALQTACALEQQPPSGQLTPLAQQKYWPAPVLAQAEPAQQSPLLAQSPP